MLPDKSAIYWVTVCIFQNCLYSFISFWMKGCFPFPFHIQWNFFSIVNFKFSGDLYSVFIYSQTPIILESFWLYNNVGKNWKPICNHNDHYMFVLVLWKFLAVAQILMFLFTEKRERLFCCRWSVVFLRDHQFQWPIYSLQLPFSLTAVQWFSI